MDHPAPPDTLDSRLEQALELYRRGEHVAALHAYEAAAAVWPSHRCHHGRGDCLQALGRLEEAVQAFRQSLEMAPRYFRSHLNLAATLLELGRSDEAGAYARLAKRLQPEDPHILALLARLPPAPTWEDVAVAPPVAAGPSARRVLLAYPAARVVASDQTTNVNQAWGLLLRRAFTAAGWQADAVNFSDLRDDPGRAPNDRYDLAVLLDYSGGHIGELISGLRRRAELVVYFNESALPEYTSGPKGDAGPDFYYQASLCGMSDFDHRAQWRAHDYLRIVPAFRTLAPAATASRRAVLVNGPLPPRYALRFEAQIASGKRFAVDINALLRRLRQELPAEVELLQLLPAPLHELQGFCHQGQPRPFGIPEWRIEPIAGVTNLEPMPISGLRPLLARCAHYVVTHQESFGGLVLDALSLGLTVHQPCYPLMRGHALVAMRTPAGFKESAAPWLRTYASLDQLVEQLRQDSVAEADLLEPAELAAQMMFDCEAGLARQAQR